MKAAIYTEYGGPDVIRLEDVTRPEPKPGEILVKVAAAGVTTADWRLRAAAFPGAISMIAGRLMFGLVRPRRPVLGSDFAGTVAAIGDGVTDFRPGDRVFGFTSGGAHAEFLTIKADGAVTKTPDDMTHAEAAALPFGGQAALEFLDRFAGLRAGERVLIVGASGGVGAYAVQVAAALGATVTGVASVANAGLVRDLGAADVVDYRETPVTEMRGPFDVVFDTVGALDYPTAARMLARGGRFVPLNFTLRDLWQARRAKRRGHRVIFKVNGDSKAGVERLAALYREGRLRPVIDRIYLFDAIHDAYAHVESRHRKGAVVLRIGEVEAQLRAA